MKILTIKKIQSKSIHGKYHFVITTVSLRKVVFIRSVIARQSYFTVKMVRKRRLTPPFKVQYGIVF